MVRLLKVNELHSKIGQFSDCFYSFFFLNGTLHSVHRRHRLFSYANWPRSAAENSSQIVLTEYKNKNPQTIHSEEILCDGNDPRVVGDGSRAFVLAEGAVHSGILYTLIELPTKKKTNVRLGPGAEPGKNWQPFLQAGELYVVDSIAPFRLNRLDLETGTLIPEKEVDIDFHHRAVHDRYSMLRGGSNALVHQGITCGWGHATFAPYAHSPYLWKFDGQAVAISLLNLYAFFRNRGYNIVDPASFFEWDADHFALSLSCSQRDWFHDQWFLNVLLIFKKEDLFKGLPFHFQIEDDSIRRTTIFHALELDSLIASSYEHGGLTNNRKKGCLLCGPSKEIDLDKKWTVELCYSSLERPGKRVGEFDILLNIAGQETTVASVKIFGTQGRSTRVPLTFEMQSEHKKALIQTRVFTRARVAVTGYFFELIHE